MTTTINVRQCATLAVHGHVKNLTLRFAGLDSRRIRTGDRQSPVAIDFAFKNSHWLATTSARIRDQIANDTGRRQPH